jgi:HEAT repeat protein
VIGRRRTVRDLGSTARALGRASVLFGAAVYVAGTGDLIIGAVFSFFLLAPAKSGLFGPFRRLAPITATVLRAAVVLLPLFESFVRIKLLGQEGGDQWFILLAHPVLIFLIIQIQQERLDFPAHIQLILGSVFLVAMGALSGSGRAVPILMALWAVPTAAALVRVHLETELDRVLRLARVRRGDWEGAAEVSGRKRALGASTLASLSVIGLWLVTGGLLLAWLTPHAAHGVSVAWGAIVGPGLEEVPPEMPEHPDGKPPFAIPEGVVGYLPFGPRLERDEFLLRREQEGLTVLLREAVAGRGPGSDALIRGECYDYLTSEGRWIRSRARERTLFDEADGKDDGRLTVDPSAYETNYIVECLVPPGPDRTLYALAMPKRLWLSRVAMDGTGNLLSAGARAPSSPYVVEACEPFNAPPGPAVAPGPEFLLLPDHLDSAKLAALVSPYLVDAETDHQRVQAIQVFLLMKFLNLPDDAPEKAGVDVASPPPERLDVDGFLFDRRWGSSIDFATTFAMLLRSVGIPCRLATGYLEGTWLTEGEFRVFRADDLTAFVEVPFPGYGWIPFEVTPAEPDLSVEDLGHVLLTPPEDRGEEVEKLEEGEGRQTLMGRILDWLDEAVTSILPGDRQKSGVGRAVAWIVLLGFGAVLLRTLLAATEKGRQALTRGLARAEHTARILFYERLLRILASRGMRRQPTETPLEFARSVLNARGEDFREVARLTNAFCAWRYGGRDIGKAKEGELLRRAEAFGVALNETDARRRAEPVERKSRLWPFVLLALCSLVFAGSVLAATPRELVEQLGSEVIEDRLAAREELLLLGKPAVPVLLRALLPETGRDRVKEIGWLIRDLDSDDYQTRANATESLKRIGPAARESLTKALEGGSPEVLRRVREILRYIDEEGRVIYDARMTARTAQRREVVYLLGQIGDERAVDPVLQVGLQFPEHAPGVKGALIALAARHPERLLAVVDGSDPAARLMALAALAAAKVPESRPRFVLLLDDEDAAVRRLAYEALVTPKVVEDTDLARLLARRQMIPEAKAGLYRVLKACPGYAEAAFLLAELLEREGDVRGAIEAIATVREIDVEGSLKYGKLLILAGETKAALELALDLTSRYPKDHRVHLLTGRVYLSGDSPEPRLAMARVDEARAMVLDSAEAWALTGRILGEYRQDVKGARDCYRRALMIEPDNEEYRDQLLKYLGR